MTPFNSSMLHSGGYDAQTKCLTIKFQKGSTFIYYGVPEEVWNGMLAAESVGKYFGANIKGKYESRKGKTTTWLSPGSTLKEIDDAAPDITDNLEF